MEFRFASNVALVFLGITMVAKVAIMYDGTRFEKLAYVTKALGRALLGIKEKSHRPRHYGIDWTSKFGRELGVLSVGAHAA